MSLKFLSIPILGRFYQRKTNRIQRYSRLVSIIIKNTGSLKVRYSTTVHTVAWAVVNFIGTELSRCILTSTCGIDPWSRPVDLYLVQHGILPSGFIPLLSPAIIKNHPLLTQGSKSMICLGCPVRLIIFKMIVCWCFLLVIQFGIVFQNVNY